MLWCTTTTRIYKCLIDLSFEAKMLKLKQEGYNLRERINIYGGMFVGSAIPYLIIYELLSQAIVANSLSGEIFKTGVVGGLLF